MSLLLSSSNVWDLDLAKEESECSTGSLKSMGFGRGYEDMTTRTALLKGIGTEPVMLAVDEDGRASMPIHREDQLDRIEAMLTRLLDKAVPDRSCAECGETEDTDYYSHRGG